MSSVDNRIVRMTFDNQKFENGVKTTIQSLANLKKGLQLEGASKSLSKLEKAADGMTFAGLAKNVDTISSRFSDLGIIGVTALQNIANRAMQTGEQMLKSLTIDPISTGFSEYETKINAIQTIMSNTASKGTTMSDITAVLNELNTYADKTIYNFAEMTKNIGTFTAAGIGLEDAASSIQGIANLAAASGSTSQQASTAMYQLSQALAAGTVKLMDWNSVVNAGMGGEKFQEALKATAREYGVSIDTIIAKNGSFRESLQEGWISADILNDTLKKFTVEGAQEYADAMMRSGKYTQEQADALIAEAQAMEDAATKVKTWTQLWDTMKESAQSGWAQSWELVVGNFLEARDFFTQISDIIGGVIEKSAESRNSMLDGALTSNWTKLTRAINSAGVETDVFEQKVREMAEASGYNVTDLIKQYDSLEGAIRKGVIPTDILNQALDALSGTIESVKIDKTTADFEKLTDTLRRGDATGSVRELQQALKDFGYDLSKYGVDGIFGAETEAAVKAFQEANGLIANGIADAKTIEALKRVGTTFSEVTVDVNKLNGECRDLVSTVTQKSGRELVLDSIINALKGVIQIGDTAKTAFDAIFDPSDDAEQLLNSITKVHSFSERMLQSITNHSDELGRALKGVFAILDIVGSTGKTIATGGLKVLCSVLGIAGDNALELAANAGDAIVAFHEWFEANNVLAKSFDYMAEGIPVLIDLAREWFEELKQTPEVQAFLSDLGEEVDNIVEYFKGGKQVILDFVSRVRSLDEINLDSLDGIFKDFYENVVSYFTDIDKVVEGGKKIFERLKTAAIKPLEAILEKFNAAKTKVGEFIDAVKEKFSGIGAAEVMLVAFSAAIVGVGFSIYKALKIISGGILGINNVTESITKAFNSISGAFNALKFNFQVRAFATMIITLVGALAVMTMLDQDKLVSSAITLGAFATLMVGVMTTLSVLQKKDFLGSFDSNAMSIVAMAASLAIMVAALKGMEYINPDRMGASLFTLAAMMAMLTTFSALLGKYSPKLSTGSLTLVAYAASMVILAEALVKISTIPTDKIVDTIVSMVVIMGAFSLLALTARGASFGSALAMIAAVVTLNALVDAFERIKMVDVNSIMANIEAFGLIFGAFAGLMVTSGLFGKNTAKAGVGILAMSAALLLIVESFDEIAKLSSADVNKATNIIHDAMYLFGAIVLVTKFAGKNGASAGVAMLAFSGSIAILSGAIKVLSGIDPTGLSNAVVAVTVLGGVLAGITFVTQFAAKASGTLIVITACVAALSVIVGLMAMINPDKLSGAVVAIAVVGAVLGGIVFLTGFAAKAGATILAIGVVIGILSACLYALSEIDAESNLANALSISAVLIAVSTAMAILSAIPVAAAGKAALGLLIGLGTVSAIVLALGGIAELCGEYDLFGKGADVLGKLGTGIGSFIGNIIGAFGAGVTSTLPQIGEDIAGFGDNLAKIDPNVGQGAEAIADAIVAIAGATVVNALASFGPGNSLSRFADMAPDFGEALTAFSESISDLSADDLNQIDIATQAAIGLTEFANEVPGTAGLFSFLDTQSNLATFADDLTIFGEAMKSYAEAVVGLDVGAIEASIGAAEALVELAKLAPRISTNWDKIAGGKGDLGTFGKDLTTFGKGMSSYAESVQGLDVGAIETSIGAAEALVELAGIAPGISTFWDLVVAGTGDLGTFGKDLTTFGKGMSSYAESVQGLDVDAITNSIAAAEGLVDLAKLAPDIATWWDHIGGGNGDLGTFGSDLTTFGSALASYSTSVVGIDTGKLDAVTASMSSLITLAGSSSVTNFEGFANFGEALTNLGKTGVDGFIRAFTDAGTRVNAAAQYMMSQFNTGITSKQGTIDSSISNIVTSALSKIRNQYTTFNTVGQTTMTQFIAGIKAKDATAQSTITTMISAMLSKIRNQYTTFNTVGQTTMTQFIAGIKAKETAATDAIANIASSCASTARDYYDSFYSAGEHCANGFANGISSRTWYAEAKARAMAAAAYEAAKSELDEHSPSKKFYEIGHFGVLGFANAFIAGLSTARTVGGDLATTALDSFKASLSRIGEVLDGGVDYQPRITPVLDLSNIREGVGQLNAMVSRNQAVTVSSNIASRRSGGVDNVSESSIPVAGNTYNYTQNITSPKPISTIEVYRQTKNLISVKEGGLAKV